MSIHSIDGRNMPTKLDRISQRATDTSCVFNNLGHVINKNLLRKHYQQQDGRKATGIDGVSKRDYGMSLETNLDALIKRIRQGSYRPKPSRLVEIPKEDGSKRPLAIACFEDKLLQAAVNEVLVILYEPIFMPCSYGFRPNSSCHKALRALMNHTFEMKNGAIVEIDIRRYFNSIPHETLLALLSKRIMDKRFLKLLKTLIKSPILEGKEIIPNNMGCPQGSIISPVLANVYLHYVIDEWTANVVSSHILGKVHIVRYADDMVFLFEHMSQAEKFYKTLPKRLKRFGLKMHEGKSQLLPSGRWAATRAHQKGKRIATYKFLGFTCYWAVGRNGCWRLKYKSRRDRLGSKLKGLKEFLRKSLNAKSRGAVIKSVIRVVVGWINYHAISDNDRRVKAFVLAVKRLLFKWINRRGGRKKMNWLRYTRMLRYYRFPERWRLTSMFKVGLK